MDKKTEISAIILREAKRQYYTNEIDFSEYEEILFLIYEKLSDLENNVQKKDYILKSFSLPNFKIDLKDTINYALALN